MIQILTVVIFFQILESVGKQLCHWPIKDYLHYEHVI